MKYFSKVILINICSYIYLFPQTDYEKWTKAEISYEMNSPAKEREYSFNGNNAGEVVMKTFINAYWFFISDVDGDNCPFKPSCSSFFKESVKLTNVFQGTLMFADRFTRDMNFFERQKHYPRHVNGKFYDPPELYILDKDISFIPPSAVVKDE